MSTFNNRSTRPKTSSPVTTLGSATTFEGASGFERSPLSDLYLLSVSGLIGKETFYEKKDPRLERYIDLIHSVSLLMQDQVTQMFPWLRTSGYLRTASVLGATEAARELCDAHRYEGVEDMVDGSLQRADELGEAVAYWFSIAGKAWPRRYQAVKRGLKRAATRLINEYSYGKYDSERRAYRFADIIEILHPAPKDQAQSDLFKLIIDRRHGRKNPIPATLPMLIAVREWRKLAASNPGDPSLLRPDVLRTAGLTWQDVMSELGGKLDKQTVWEACIAVMPPYALLSNLRNFDEVGISDAAARKVMDVIGDGERVRRAKIFPYRFLAAYRASPSLRWGHALETGLAGSLELVPRLKGKTLVLVDRSPSMFPGYNGSTPNDSDITLADQAALFGASLAVKGDDVTLVEFGGDSALSAWGGRSQRGVGSRRISVPRGASVLKVVDSFGDPINGTDIPRAVKDNFTSEYKRVVIITDEQSRPGYLPSNMDRHGGWRETAIDDLIPKDVPVYIWNMAGYSSSILKSGPTRHLFGGLSDASFGLFELAEKGKNAPWPWLLKAEQEVRG